jgi:cellulose synthase/poly-beta-1,6-N-acetylglucosamine synthase-like glycosyltransferase
MFMFEIILIVAASLYLLQAIVFVLGVSFANYRKRTEFSPTVSVIVAARNEEQNIGDCLASLVKIEYPQDQFEIIIVNDGSTDTTGCIIEEYTKQYPFVKTLQPTKEIGHLRGKANAVAQGIDASTGEIIMMTDADCQVQPTWVKETLRYFDNDIGIIPGFTMIETKTWFDGMQSLDWAFLLMVAAAGIAYKTPLSCVGNNLSFRRKAYDEVGGYRNIKFSVTEDFALMQAITQKTQWKACWPLDKNALVMSKPCPTGKDLYRQKKRWGTGGIDEPLLGYLVMGIGWITTLLILFSPLFATHWSQILVPLGFKFFADILLMSRPLKEFGKWSLLKYFFHFEVYYFLYVIILPFIVFAGGHVIWKDRTY